MRRISLSLALVFACLLVLAACGGKSSSKSASSGAGSESAAGAEIVPASATAFASINTDSTGAQWKQATELMARVPSLQSSLEKQLTKAGITLSDVEEALGPTTDIVQLASSSAASKGAEVYLTNPKDPAKLKAILAKDKTEKSVTTEIDSWIVVAQTQAALDQFKSDATSGKLADSANFKAAIAEIPADSLVRAYFDGSVITASATSSLGSSSSSSSGALKKALAKNQVEWGALGASAVAKGFSIDGIFKGKKTLANSSLSLIDELPSGTSFAVDLDGKALGFDKAVTSLSKNSKYASQIPQIEAALGVKMTDLATLAGSEMSIYGTESGIGLLIKAADANASKAMLDKAVALLASQANGSSKSTTVGGVQATEVTFGTTKIDYGVKDGNLFVVTDAASLPGATKLSSDSAYSAVASELTIPSSNLGVGYIDFTKLATLAKSGSSVVSSLGSSTGTNANLSNLKNLEGLSSLLGYAVANGDKFELKAFLSVK